MSMWHKLGIENADMALQEEFLAATEATNILRQLLTKINWRRDSIRLFGQSHPIPRMHQWHAEPGINYTWSGLTMRAEPWFPELDKLRQQVELATNGRFNSVLINLYRDGSDSMGWHSDDEPELGPEPTIASLSLGAERDFLLRSVNTDAREDKHCIKLGHGSLLLMQGRTQQNWQHALPRRLRVKEARINLTFRWINTEQNDRD